MFGNVLKKSELIVLGIHYAKCFTITLSLFPY
jgi:hypothetical protein